MAKKTVSDLSKSGQVNSFTGGINTDLHPMLQPNDTLTDCLNGTLITYNGNENMLQNDMGNYELKHAQLPEGYIPMGMKEYQGVLYIASWNPFTKKAQIGSYPSPRTIFGDNIEHEYVVKPLQINSFDLKKDYYRDTTENSKIENVYDREGNPQHGLSEIVFILASGKKLYYKEDGVFKEYDVNHLVSKIDYSESEVIFTDNFSEETTLGMGDRYFLSSDKIESSKFQSFQYFIIDKNKNKYDVTDYIESISDGSNFDPENLESYTPVTFEHNGWLGGRYTLFDADINDISVEITKNADTSDNLLSKIEEKESDLDDLHNIEQIYKDGSSPDYISTILSDGQRYVYPKDENIYKNPEIINNYQDGVDKLNKDLNLDLFIGDDFITVITLGPEKEKLEFVDVDKEINAIHCWKYRDDGDKFFNMYKIYSLVEFSVKNLHQSVIDSEQELHTLFIPSTCKKLLKSLGDYTPHWISKVVFTGNWVNRSLSGVFRNVGSIDFVGDVSSNTIEELVEEIVKGSARISEINYINQYIQPEEYSSQNRYINGCESLEYNWTNTVVEDKGAPYNKGNEQCYYYGNVNSIDGLSSVVSVCSNNDVTLEVYDGKSYILDVPSATLSSSQSCSIKSLWYKRSSESELSLSDNIKKIENLVSLCALHVETKGCELTNLNCTYGISDDASRNAMVSENGEKLLFTTSGFLEGTTIDFESCEWIKTFNEDSWGFISNKNEIECIKLPFNFIEGVELRNIFPNLKYIYYHGYNNPYIPWGLYVNAPVVLYVLPINIGYYNSKQRWLHPTTIPYENGDTRSWELHLSLPSGYSLLKDFISENDKNTYLISKHGTRILSDITREVTKTDGQGDQDDVVSCTYTVGVPSILSEEELPYNNIEKYNKIACHLPCTIPVELSTRTKEWHLDKDCTIVLSEKGGTYSIYLLNADVKEDDVINFCDNIVINSDNEYNINIFSVVSGTDINYVPKSENIHFTFAKTDINNVKENTIEYFGNFTDENCPCYCNSKLVGTSDNNVYKITFTSEDLNSESIIEALNRLPKTISEASLLIFPQNFEIKNIESSSWDNHPMLHVFLPSSPTSWGANTSLLDTIDSYVTNIGLSGNYDSSYRQLGWNWNKTSDCGTHELLLTLSGNNTEDDFGILLKTFLIKNTENGILTKNISTYTGFINKYPIGECFVTEQTHNNINIELENQENVFTALQISAETGENKYVVVNNNFTEYLPKADSYEINAYLYKYVDEKLLIFDTNKKSLNLGVSEIKSDLLSYKYYTSDDHLMHIYLEFYQILDNRNASWRIVDLENQLLFNGQVAEEYSNKVNITFSIQNNTSDVGIFEYHVNGIVYKKPIFLKNTLTSLDKLNYSDYSNAYYDELCQFTPKFEVKLEDIPEKFPSCGGKMQLAQRTQKTGNVEKFTHDSRYNIKKYNGTWWNMTEELISGEGDTYLGTRLYKNASFNLSDMGFIKGRTSFSVSINAEGYDKEFVLRPDSIYTAKDDSTFKCEIPVVETKRKISFENDCVPFVRRYLVQDTYPMIGNTKLFNTNNEDLDNENLSILTKVCDWDTPKMLFIDKAAGENNDCTIAWADSTKYSKDADCFSNGDYCSGEGDVKNYVWDKLKSIFVPVIVRIKSNDEGFVFPIPRNKNWTYKWKYIEARGKKNSDNKRNLTKNGISSIVCTKNNMAAAIVNLILGAGELLAMVALWIGVAAASVGTIFMTGGAGIGLVTSTVAMSATTLISVSSALFGLGCAQFSAGLAELLKKEKTFKLLAIRGNNTLLLPLLGEQSNSKKFPAQARYETETKEGDFSFDKIEQMMFYLGSRLYAKDYKYPGDIAGEYYKKPVWAEEHSQTVNYTLTIKATNVEIQTDAGFSIEVLDKTFSDIYGISTTNFKTKNPISTTWTTKLEGEVSNMWESDDWNGLEKQTSEDCTTNTGDAKIGDYNDIYSSIDAPDTLMHNLIACIKYHPGTKHFFYHEINNEGEVPEYMDDIDTGKWRINDNKWAFGPNRGGAAIRLLRNYWKGDKKSKKDHDYICIGEYPVFNSQISTPIARPIIPVDLRDKGSGYEYKEKDGVDIRSNYFNSYNTEAKVGESPVWIKNKDFQKDNLITEECMTYLKYMYYDNLKIKD